MSFLSVLKSIQHGIQIVAGIAPLGVSIAAAADPAAAPVANRVLSAIMATEALTEGATAGGPAKQAAALNLVNAVHPGLDQTRLTATIDASVAALNALTAALAKAPAPPAAAKPAQETTPILDAPAPTQ